MDVQTVYSTIDLGENDPNWRISLEGTGKTHMQERDGGSKFLDYGPWYHLGTMFTIWHDYDSILDNENPHGNN